jgi:hypothetical protein
MIAVDWDEYKHYARIFYSRASELVVFLQLLVYLWGCVVAGRPIGLKDYAAYLYHCFQWTPGIETGVTNGTPNDPW